MSVSLSAMGIAELAEFLAASGTYSTVAEAMAALNIVIVEDVGAAGTALAVTGGPGQLVVGTVGQTALDVAAQSQLAATGSNVTTSSIGLLQGETATSAAAILGMDVGIVGAAAAPILGVALGAGLYQSNPELWTKISQKLLPFCYPGTTKIPTWAEIVNDAWQVSVAKQVIDALKELFEEEGIGQESSVSQTSEMASFYGYTMPAIPISDEVSEGPWNNTSYVSSVIYTEGNHQIASYKFEGGTNAPNLIVASLSDLGGSLKFYRHSYFSNGTDRTDQYNMSRYSYVLRRTGQTVYYYTPTYGYPSDSYSPSPAILPSAARTESILDTIVNGIPSSGGYPEGTSEWTGNTPQTIPESKPAVIGIDSSTGQAVTQPMVPIAPPYPIIEVPAPEEEPEPELIPFPWPEPEVTPHTVPWPETMPWPLPAEQPEWWPVEIPYPYNFPVPQPTIDPEKSPNPDEITDPKAQVEPYVQPLPLPYELPYPEPCPQPEPELDPSKPRPPTINVVPDPPIGRIIDIIPPVGISPWPGMPDTPLAFSQGGGLVTVYHPTAAQLYAFEQWLWVTYADATIDKIFNNPFDGVITLFELYCTPTDVGSNTIKSGFLDSGINSAVISRYTEIDCGTLGIPEYYGNYLDYSPYSKAHVYLPFIGVVELNVDDIVGHAVNITYRIDEYNGSCIAMITVAKVTEVNGEEVEYSNTMYQFSGNCAVELPLSGGSQAAIKAGMMQADAYQNAANISAGASLVGGLGSLLLGSVGGALSGIGSAASSYAYGKSNALSNMLSGKSTVQKSGTFGSSHGAMGIKTPFITITRPKQIQVPNYNELYGYPAHKMVYIGDCTGFIRCREVHVISATANDEEKAEIEYLLKTGVYVTE